MGFSKVMASTAGRALRVLAGLVLIVAGGILGGGWWAIAVSAWSHSPPAHSTSACSTSSSDSRSGAALSGR